MMKEATKHISVRLAWHDSGWNGRICRDPRSNTHCVGQLSILSDKIPTDRDLTWEQPCAGKPCHRLERMPPCAASVNAFGPDAIVSYEAPPAWFRDGTDVKRLKAPPYTVATWPYEEMHKDEVWNPECTTPKHNPVRRREAANEYFTQISPDRSLVFYYANYRNPFSENDQHFYVVVGASRIKAVGEELTWVNQSPRMEQRYGPNVWLRNITSHYPDQGLRIAHWSTPCVLRTMVRSMSERSSCVARHFLLAPRRRR